VEASLTTCSHCKRKILPHHVCPYCGYYRGREILKLETKLTKRSKRRREKKAEKHQAEEESDSQKK